MLVAALLQTMTYGSHQ